MRLQAQGRGVWNYVRLWKPALLVAVAMSIGCAIFPSNPGAQFTKLVFTVNLNGQPNISDPYIYGIVISLQPGLPMPQLPPTGAGMAPVLGPGSLNGMFTGLATNALILWSLADTANPVDIYTFGSTPVDTGGVSVVPGGQSGTTIDQLSPDANGNLPAQLTFTVFLNQLQATNPQSYDWVQFQVLTMNKTALGGSSGRLMDALGISPNFTATPWLPIYTSSGSPGFTGAQLYSGLTMNTTPPSSDGALTIQSVTLQVSVP